MGTFNGNAQGGRFSARRAKTGVRAASAGKQILYSLLLLLDLFLLYTIIMQLTHRQQAFQAGKAVNLMLLVLFILGAVALAWLVYRARAWKRLLCLFLIFVILYLIVVFSNIPFVKKYRDIWIKTAMSTMWHQGLATYYFPASQVDEIERQKNAAIAEQEDQNSTDPAVVLESNPDPTGWTEPTGTWSGGEVFKELSPEQKQFYSMFYELDVESAEAYFTDHPDALENGYMHMLVNESSLDSDGTSIRTKLGEKVLAIDTENQILILEVDADGARGVMAIAKDPTMLHLCPATTLPAYGQVVGKIAKNNNGILAMTGSGFIDEGGSGNGGQIAGFARCGGKDYGKHYGWGYKRLELHDNDWFYLRDAFTDCSDSATDAMEFQPGLLINGERLDPLGWTGLQPRACIGQSSRGEILMLCVEGRGAGGSWGCSVVVCADILLQHDGINAINCDGGTTAIMWYRGEPIMRCSNSAIPQGRYLPNAWVIIP